MKHHIGVIIIIKDRDRILLIQETKPECHGKWCFPVGHTEPNETTFAAAIREAKEETGYDVKVTNTLGLLTWAMDDNLRSAPVFTADITGGSPSERLINESSSVEWFTLDEIQNMAASGQLRFPRSTLSIADRLFKNQTYSTDFILDIDEGQGS